MYLDHANIVTPDLDSTVGFFIDILGLTSGPRPNFRIPGYWLYSAGKPVIHLTQATLASSTARVSPRIDHVALRIADLDEWKALLDRLKTHDIEYEFNAGNDDVDAQVWIPLAAGLTIEIIVARQIVSTLEMKSCKV